MQVLGSLSIDRRTQRIRGKITRKLMHLYPALSFYTGNTTTRQRSGTRLRISN